MRSRDWQEIKKYPNHNVLSGKITIETNDGQLLRFTSIKQISRYSTFRALEYFSEIEKFYGFQNINSYRIKFHFFSIMIALINTRTITLQICYLFMKYLSFHH